MRDAERFKFQAPLESWRKLRDRMHATICGLGFNSQHFTFTQTFGGASNQITRTAAFQGAVKFTGGQIQWTFSATGSTIELAIGTDIKLGPIQADARLNIGMDGGEFSGVTFLLGVNF